MKTMMIKGVRCTLTTETAAQIEREMREIEWERETREWLATPAARECPDYSDIYKDVYGIRPRW